jgi:hypothetical protein
MNSSSFGLSEARVVPATFVDYSRGVPHEPLHGEDVLRARIDAVALGPCLESDITTAFGASSVTNGVREGRVACVEVPPGTRAIRVRYPVGAVGPAAGGAQWSCQFGACYDALTLSYELCFAPDFDFVLGGKLPGLAGGKANTGGDKPNGYDGFSARMMWRAGGEVVQYLYHPDQPGVWGEDLPWNLGAARYFHPGRWHSLKHEIRLNRAGERNGSIRGFFDGELALARDGVRFRDTPELGLDQLYFSTFFGGNTPEWAPTRDEHVDFGGFCVTSPGA